MSAPVLELFDSFTEGYSDHFSRKPSARTYSFRKRLSLACELTASLSGRMLECAAGTGEITHALLQSGRFTEASIVDISPQMLASTKRILTEHEHAVRCDFVNSDIFKYRPECGEPYELIVCLGLVAHTGRLGELLEHLRSMLAEEGALLLQTSLEDHLGNRIVRALTSRRYASRFGYSIAYYRHQHILDACQEAGLKVSDMRRHTVGIPFGDRVWARGNYNVERRLESWAAKHGSDALYLLGHS